MSQAKFKMNQDTPEGNQINAITSAGIYDDMVLEEVSFEKLGKSETESINITWVSPEGKTFRHVEFEPDVERIKKNQEENPWEHKRGDKKGQVMTPDERVQTEVDQQMTRLFHILTKYVDKSKVNIEVTTWDQLGKKYTKLLQKGSTDQPVRLLIQYNYNGTYVEFPKFPPFIESMEVPREKTELKPGTYHRMTPPAGAASDVEADVSQYKEDKINSKW